MLQEALRMVSVSKKTGDGILALKNISLVICRGEIVRLFGHEGQSGTGVLVELLDGALRPDSGEVYVDGKSMTVCGIKCGISVVRKQSGLVPNLSVLDNMLLNENDWSRTLARKQKISKAEDVLKAFGFEVSIETAASSLTAEQAQIVQLGKALLNGSRIVVLDYTNTLLSAGQAKLFEDIFRELAGRGAGVLIVTQCISDYHAISDKLYILNGGTMVGCFDKQKADRPEVAEIAAGDLSWHVRGNRIGYFGRYTDDGGDTPRMRVDALAAGRLKNVSFSVEKGEIVCLIGADNSGKRDLAYAIYGLERLAAGNIYLDGEKVKIENPSDAVKNKIGLISFEGAESGLLSNLSFSENISILRLHNISRLGFLRKKLESWLVKALKTDWGIDIDWKSENLKGLSPVDRRKVVIARVMCMVPKVLIAVNPTEGLDDESRWHILDLLSSFADKGVSILLVSSNVREMLRISHRALIFSGDTVAETADMDDLEQKSFRSVYG